MADDALITATTSVDTSGLKSGGDEALNITRSQLAILQEQYRSASKDVRESVNRIVDAEKQAAEAIASGHKQLAVAIQSAADTERIALDSLITKQAQLQSSITGLKASMDEAEEPAVTLADGLQRLAFFEALAAQAATEYAEATQHGVTAVQAASSEIRILEGNLPIRAIERLTVTTLGLGDVMQAAFVPFAAIAMGELVVHIGEAAYHAGENFLFLKQAEDETLRLGADLARETEAAFKEAVEREAKALRDRGLLVAAAKKEQEALLSEPIHLPKINEGKLKGLDPAELAQIKNAFGEVIPAQLPDRLAMVRDRIANLTKSLSDLQSAKNQTVSTSEALAAGEGAVGVRFLENTRTASQYRVALQLYGELLQALEAQQERFAGKVQEAGARIAAAHKEEAQRRQAAAREQQQAYRKSQEEEKSALDDGVKVLEETYGKTSQILVRYLEAQSTALNKYPELQKLINEKLLTIFAERARLIEEVSQHGAKVAEEQKKHGERQLAWLEQMAIEATQIGEKMGAQIAKNTTKLEDLKTADEAQSEIGGLRKQKAGVERTAALSISPSNADRVTWLQEEARLNDKIAQAQIEALEKIAAREKDLYGEKSIQYQQAEDKITQVQRQAELQRYQDETKILQQQQAQYRIYFDQITRGFQNTVNGWLTGQKSFAAGLQTIWAGIIQQFADYEIKRVAIWLSGTAAIKAAESSLSAILQALHLTTAATTVATDKASATDQIATGAAVAAVNTFAAISAIPIVGPELAPAAASAAYAEALSFGALAAFETGGIIPNTGVALVHQGEAVLPQPLTQMLLNTAGQGAGGGHTFNVTQNITGGPNHSAQDIGNMALSALQAYMRRNNLRMA